MKKGIWREQAFGQQLSRERDFTIGTPTGFRFAICCGHRTGSRLLSEALFRTGRAGDPMEFFNLGLLDALKKKRNETELDLDGYWSEMRSRRTSPNGVFGVTIKFDQLYLCFKDKWESAQALIKDNDHVVFLYRRDKLAQAISLYIAQSRDLYGVPADVSDETIESLVHSVPFNALAIARSLQRCIQIDDDWRYFFTTNDISFVTLAYEDLVENYDHHIDRLLEIFGVPSQERRVPAVPMKKVANRKNDELRENFLEFISGREELGDPGRGSNGTGRNPD